MRYVGLFPAEVGDKQCSCRDGEEGIILRHNYEHYTDVRCVVWREDASGRPTALTN